MRKIILFVFIILISEISSGNTFTVTNTNDSGTGSLRSTITSSNSNSGSDVIAFNIPTSDANYNSSTGTWTITLASYLPYITNGNTTIDGTTQTTNQGDTNPNGPEIIITGVNNTIAHAFCIMNTANNIIKGITLQRLVCGIQIYGANAKNNHVYGNYIGTNYNATDSLGNNIGIEIISGAKHNIVGGSSIEERNIVSGNRHIGIRIVNADSNIVSGNFVGTNRTATASLGNYDGVSIEGTAKYNNVGGNNPALRNIISGNNAYGVPIIGTDAKYNKVFGNYIGTDINGSAAIPNTYGVLFDDGSSYNIIGGDSISYRNIISGNSGYGVFVYNNGTNHNTVKGNFIGTDKNGTLALPNGNGVVIDGAPVYNYIDNNVISGNAQQGIDIHVTYTDNNSITRNKIGTDSSGLLPLGNAFDGIRIAEGAKNNIIGGSAGNGNIIAYNGSAGIFLMTAGDINNKISCNSIHNNGTLGIDLFPIGTNLNDAGDSDTGPNMMMNYPVITSADYWTYNGLTFIQGTIDCTNPLTTNIEIYIADSDSNSYGEGKTYLGCVTPDAGGNWSIHLSGINAGDVITSTATDASGNTSEFSHNAYVNTYTGLNDLQTNDDVEIYPNPFPDFSILNFEYESKNNYAVLIYNNVGQITKSIENISNGKVIIDRDNLKNGIYFLQLKKNNEIIKTSKIIID
ncbi:MAG TPA: T9SS type A sorting domain-containing protein [Bacteroidales bacterium]|nr:T9SS type A sorting domain-containing protein [Bacteroidales bacterium]HPS17336.1 T9SS type A sorting domain-containing protein [Bacteroidales bacterium]